MQTEVEGIIWEADEDCDGCLTWAEFQSMYDRCRNDQTGRPLSLLLMLPSVALDSPEHGHMRDEAFVYKQVLSPAASLTWCSSS